VKLEHQKKIRVGIIMGGISSEREISLESGRNIFSKIDRKDIFPYPYLWIAPVFCGKYRSRC